jgi:hypothetical protein
LAAPLFTGRFSSSIERRKPDLLKPRFGFWTFTWISLHLSTQKRPEFAHTAFHWKISIPVLKGVNPICLNQVLISGLLPGIAFNFQNLPDPSLAAPLFTGRFSLPVLKCGTPIYLSRDGFWDSSRHSVQLSKL